MIIARTDGTGGEGSMAGATVGTGQKKHGVVCTYLIMGIAGSQRWNEEDSQLK